ncbi:type II secretion system protein [Hydrogenophaga sp.]|uniref:type II secretion system protein n=1 Tax=Hydrogenophaga sp. TaxID=1904254 RepID=UPI003AF8A228
MTLLPAPMYSSARGFTLIELLVVLAIVATLSMMVYPRYSQRIDMAKETTLQENLRSVRAVIDDFRGDKGRYPESLEELVEQRYLKALPLDPITESSSTWRIIAPPDGLEGAVYDLHSGAAGVTRNGRAYADW